MFTIRLLKKLFHSSYLHLFTSNLLLLKQVVAITSGGPTVEFYLYPTVGTVLIHSVKPRCKKILVNALPIYAIIKCWYSMEVSATRR